MARLLRPEGSRPALKRHIFEKYYSHFVTSGDRVDIEAQLDRPEISPTTRSVMDEILEKYRDKVILLDFWATWCGPCLGELERGFPKLMKTFDGEAVAFVFLAHHSEKDRWRELLTKWQLGGDHYLLTGDQARLLSHLFGVSALPHHAIIDRKGQIAFRKGPELGSSLSDAIRQLLRE